MWVKNQQLELNIELNIESEFSQSCLTLCDPIDCSPPGSPVHGDSPGKNTGVGCHFLPHNIEQLIPNKERSMARLYIVTLLL